MTKFDNQLCLWSGCSFLVFYIIGFVFVAGFIPAPSPGLSAEAISELFAADSLRIRIGMLICVLASPLLLNWVIAVYLQMRRMTPDLRGLSLCQLLNGAVLVAFFMLPPILWAGMAYRVDIDPAVMRVLNDVAWFAWIISWPYAFFQQLALAIAGIKDQSAQPILPRWLCYLTIWAAISLMPAAVVVFVKGGPFAWNGLFGLYLPLAIYVCWFMLLSYQLNSNIQRLDEGGG